MDWVTIKTSLTDITSLGRDALHIISGLGIHVLLVFTFRSFFGALVPWTVTLGIALANEWLDLSSEIWVDELRHEQWEDSAKDVVTTMLVPTVLLVLSRFAPAKLRRPPGAMASE
jgi:hypothetical protein